MEVEKGFYKCPECENGYIKITGDSYYGEPDEMEEPQKCEACNGTGIRRKKWQ